MIQVCHKTKMAFFLFIHSHPLLFFQMRLWLYIISTCLQAEIAWELTEFRLETWQAAMGEWFEKQITFESWYRMPKVAKAQRKSCPVWPRWVGKQKRKGDLGACGNVTSPRRHNYCIWLKSICPRATFSKTYNRCTATHLHQLEAQNDYVPNYMKINIY